MEILKELPLGSHRLRCECSNGNKRPLSVTVTLGKITYYCFKCNIKGIINTLMSPEEYIKSIKEDVTPTQGKCTLPRGLVSVSNYFKGNVRCLKLTKWLLSANIIVSYLDQIGVLVHPTKHYLVFPYYKQGNLQLYQIRTTGDIKNFTQKAQGVTAMFPILKGRDKLVITEDPLSAIKASQWVDSIALLGTNPHTELIPLCSDYKCIYIWLDSDTAGRKGDSKLRSLLSLLNIPLISICTPEDLKLTHNKEIRHKLNIEV